ETRQLSTKLMADTGDWRRVASGMTTLRLSLPVRMLVPALWASSLPRNAIGFSFERGRTALLLGCVLGAASLAVGALLYPVTGILGLALPLWLVGSAAALMVATALRPLAFVKPLCSGCRLLPVIEEHEAIHLSGQASDDEVWKVMRARHSCESLGLVGDPSICSFCPIPKRLAGH
ncbi:MAG: hypothetical protein JRM80_10720, partial [Nitrososphaerota archaeon]|nr:hypothetical protein [Nitrososphaerota archaeon]